jgi:hypothetical protein
VVSGTPISIDSRTQVEQLPPALRAPNRKKRPPYVLVGVLRLGDGLESIVHGGATCGALPCTLGLCSVDGVAMREFESIIAVAEQLPVEELPTLVGRAL